MKKQDKVEVNMKVLTQEERAEYGRRSRKLDDPTLEARWERQHVVLGIAAAACFVLGMVLMILTRGNDAAQMVSGILTLASWPLVMVTWVLSHVRISRPLRILAQQAADYLVEINYDERLEKWQAKRGIASGDDDDGDGRNYSLTGTYDPGRYYGYSLQERDVMRATGIDADTYDSNWPS